MRQAIKTMGAAALLALFGCSDNNPSANIDTSVPSTEGTDTVDTTDTTTKQSDGTESPGVETDSSDIDTSDTSDTSDSDNRDSETISDLPTDDSDTVLHTPIAGYGEETIGFRNGTIENSEGIDDDTSDFSDGVFIAGDTDADTDVDIDVDMDIDFDFDTESESHIPVDAGEFVDTETEPPLTVDAGGDTEKEIIPDTETQNVDTETPEDETTVDENPFYTASDMPVNTFSLDVDTGSYTLARQYLNNGQLPPPESVRVEEMINYFKYNYELPTGDDPFTIYTEMSDCPWNDGRKLVMIGLRGQQVELTDQPAANLVYLIDVSGSMYDELQLMKAAFRTVTKQLRPQDTLSIVTYAGNESVVLDGGNGDNKETILAAINNLESGGSTNGAGGIQKAYELAEKHFKEDGNNRVILATDGDFNVGVTSDEQLVQLIEEKRETGVFLTVYGVATYSSGNYQDEKMEQLADHGNGTYFFIDGEAEARRAFTHSLSGTMLTIAKDVKLQVQFNPDRIKGYRLIGYDNRTMSNDDFNNDTVDAGELGNAEDMTAFYEVILADSDEPVPPTDSNVDVNAESETEYDLLGQDEILAIRMRYKLSNAEESTLFTHPVNSLHIGDSASLKFVFASAVAHLGLILRESAYIENQEAAAIDDYLMRNFSDPDLAVISELRAMIDKATKLKVALD